MKVALIGSGAGRSIAHEMFKHFTTPVVILQSPKFSEERAKEILDKMRDNRGMAVISIEPPEIEMIPYVKPKLSRLKQYRQFPGKNKKI